MNKWSFIFLSVCFSICAGREPFKPAEGSIQYLVYFSSRYRGLCVGSLVARMVVLTAAVCVTNPYSTEHDTRYINIVAGTSYRHQRRGIRVQVTKILIPKLPENVPFRAYLLEKSVALLLLKRKVPDALTEVPMRAISIDWRGEEVLSLREDCFMPGWHFFYKGDTIYPDFKFLLQRQMRVQFLRIVKMHEWCDALAIRFEKSLTHVGYEGYFESEGHICVKDPNRKAQPCHGMYGAPLLCKARQVAILLAPDAQWANCTGFSNVVHLLNANFLREFMTCVNSLFEPDIIQDWKQMVKIMEGEPDTYDYIPNLYGKLLGESSSEEGAA